MTCRRCKQEMVVELAITGGCMGHVHGEDCYCDSLDVNAAFVCVNSMCKYRNRRVPIQGLRDSYGIERFLTKVYRKELVEE